MGAGRRADVYQIGLFFFQHLAHIGIFGGNFVGFAESIDAVGIYIHSGGQINALTGSAHGPHMRIGNAARANNNGSYLVRHDYSFLCNWWFRSHRQKGLNLQDSHLEAGLCCSPNP